MNGGIKDFERSAARRTGDHPYRESAESMNDARQQLTRHDAEAEALARWTAALVGDSVVDRLAYHAAVVAAEEGTSAVEYFKKMLNDLACDVRQH